MKDRTIQILSRFIRAEYPLTIDELSTQFIVSERTIRNEIKEINAFLVNEKIAEIRTIRKRGMLLKITSNEKRKLANFVGNIDESEYLSREERILDLILAFSLDDKKVFLYQKEKEYQISKSTMDEDMRRVRNTLIQYGIEVLSIPKQGIVLKGAERTIRTMIYDIINNSIGVINYLTEVEERMTVPEKLLFAYLPKDILKKIDCYYEVLKY